MIESVREMKQGGAFQTILVAMKPDTEEATWRDAGVDDFVFRGCDNYRMNRKVLATVEMKL